MTQAERVEHEVNEMYNLIADNQPILSTDIVNKLGLNIGKVTQRAKTLLKQGKIISKKHNRKRYYAVSQSALDKIKPRIIKIHDILLMKGDMTINQMIEELDNQYSKSSIYTAIDEGEHDINVFKYYAGTQNSCYLTLDVSKTINKHNKRTHVTTSPIQTARSNRGHVKFRKYNDESIKVNSQMLQTLVEVMNVFQTSADPYLFIFKLRHRIETMPPEYWHEHVSISAYVDDIDMVELPKTGANKDIDRSP